MRPTVLWAGADVPGPGMAAQVIEEHLQEVLKVSSQRSAKLDPSPDLLQRFMSGGSAGAWRADSGALLGPPSCCSCPCRRAAGCARCPHAGLLKALGGGTHTSTPVRSPRTDNPPDMRELTPWFEAYRSEFMRLLRFGDHETLDYPVACACLAGRAGGGEAGWGPR